MTDLTFNFIAGTLKLVDIEKLNSRIIHFFLISKVVNHMRALKKINCISVSFAINIDYIYILKFIMSQKYIFQNRNREIVIITSLIRYYDRILNTLQKTEN
jgi:hypothetical protein